MVSPTLPLPQPNVPLFSNEGKPTQAGYEFLDRLQSVVKQINAAVLALPTPAPVGAQYVTLANDGTLSAERVLTAGQGITFTDGGANNPLTVEVSAGAVLQVVQATYTTNADITTTIPTDDTTPLISEGTEILSASITPVDNNNKILCIVDLSGGADAVASPVMALFRGSTCINAKIWTAMTAGTIHDGDLVFLDSPASASAQTYSVRVGTGTGATIRLNGNATQRFFGGVSACTLTLMEVKA
jgi:hypothetical protein